MRIFPPAFGETVNALEIVLRLLMRCQQCVYSQAQILIARTHLVEERGTPAHVEFERLAQELVDVLPALRLHGR